MHTQVLKTGLEVVTNDGAPLGRICELEEDRFRIAAPLEPDYWREISTIEAAATKRSSLHHQSGSWRPQATPLTPQRPQRRL